MKNVETMNCSEALRLARDCGMRVSRLAWNEEHNSSWVGSLTSEVFGLTCESFSISNIDAPCPQFYFATTWNRKVDGAHQPVGSASLGYSPSKEDVLALDWFVIDNKGFAVKGQGK